MIRNLKSSRFFRLLGLATLVAALSVAPRVEAQIATFENAFPELEFEFPVAIRFPEDGLNRVYIVERAGRVLSLDNDASASETDLFLDISERFETSPPGDLFAIEFHPDYEENGYFFARYKLQEPARTVLSRFSRSANDPFVADPESEVILFSIETPGNTQNHYAGDLAFGTDGYLYVPTGDGGTYLDAAGNAQDRSVLLGKVLRLDVDNPSGSLNYGIPPDNPYVGNDQGWREEIFATGFRNPWRISADRLTGDIWVGNVGESTWEEVEYVQAGGNYGWPIMEGPVCAPFGPPECDQEGLTPPVWAYTHEEGVSVIGGYVYRGNAIPALRGKYVFSDFGSFTIWYIDRDAPEQMRILLPDQYNATTFGEGPDGEIYFNRFFEGRIFKITPGPNATDTTSGPTPAKPFALSLYPNPSAGPMSLYFESESGPVRAVAYDVLGREVAVLFNETVGPGTQRTVSLDTGRWPSGVYIVRIESGAESETQKLIITR